MGNNVNVLNICCVQCSSRSNISQRDIMKKPLTASEMTESFSKMYDTKRNNKIKEITKNKKLNSSLSSRFSINRKKKWKSNRKI